MAWDQSVASLLCQAEQASAAVDSALEELVRTRSEILSAEGFGRALAEQLSAGRRPDGRHGVISTNRRHANRALVGYRED